MKTTIIALCSFIVLNLQAVTLEFVGPCSEEPIVSFELGDKFQTVGDATLHTLEKNNIPFKGTSRGLNSVFNTPVGMEALEVLSDFEMRSHGWCYSVDGVSPEVYPDELFLNGPDGKIQNIRWFFGFAHYVRGEWISQCEPSFGVASSFLCGDNY